MYARLITAESSTGDLDPVVRLANTQLASAREAPGYRGYALLAEPETGEVLILSLWDSTADLDAVADDPRAGRDGIRYDGIADTGLVDLRLRQYEVLLIDAHNDDARTSATDTEA